MPIQNVVIIGAGYAGLLCALRLSREPKACITLINASDHFIERIRLHQVATGQPVRHHPLAKMIAGRGITFIQGMVTRIDEDAVFMDETRVPYDRLVYALGSLPEKAPIVGLSEHAFTLHPSDSVALQASLRQEGHVLIVGGGLTGIEAATEIAEAFPHRSVTLVTQGRVGEGLSPKARHYLHSVFEELHVTVCEGVQVEALHVGYAQTNHGDLPFTTCIWAGRFTVPTLARESGIQTNERGQVVVDEQLRSVSHPRIYAIGDSAAVKNLRMACATAMPLGTHSAENLIRELNGQPLKPFAFSYALQCISLGRKRGLIQFVNPDDSPQDRIITGAIGATMKELVCRYTIACMKFEQRMPNYGYLWKK